MKFRDPALRLTTAAASIMLVVLAMLAGPQTGRAADQADMQRAWLTFPVVAIDPAAIKLGQPITYTLAIRNQGQAPATDVTIVPDNGFIVFGKGDDLAKLLFNVNDMCRGVSVENTELTVPPTVAGDATDGAHDGTLRPPYKTVLSTDVRPGSVIDEDILSGTTTLFVRGCVLYKTMDKPDATVGKTQYCHLIDLTKDTSGHVTAVTAHPCPKGNTEE